MDVVITALISCALLGTVVGFFAGLLGIGGGLIIVPVLAHLLPSWGFQPEHIMVTAIGTSLSTIILTGYSSLRAHNSNGNVEWDKVLPLSVGVALATTLVAMMAEDFSAQGLKYFFSVCVAILALKMLVVGNFVSNTPVNFAGLLGVGTFTGAISSLLGIGGGAILVPALVWFHVALKKAIGSAAVCTFVVAIFGSLGYVLSGLNTANLPEMTLGYVYLPAFFGIVLTSVFTAPIGANVANRMDTQKLKKVFAIFLLGVAGKMFFF